MKERMEGKGRKTEKKKQKPMCLSRIVRLLHCRTVTQEHTAAVKHCLAPERMYVC